MPASLLPRKSKTREHLTTKRRIAQSGMPPGPRPAGKPWSIAELAVHLGMSERQIHRWIAAGMLRAVRISSRVFIPDSVVQSIVENGMEPRANAATAPRGEPSVN